MVGTRNTERLEEQLDAAPGSVLPESVRGRLQVASGLRAG